VIPAPRPLARLLLIGTLAAAPLAAQVGHRPEASPYEDLRGRQAVTIGIGRLTPDSDPAGVGPGSGYLLTGRYELQIATPLWLQSRIGLAPGLRRTVKDPLLTGDERIVGTEMRPLLMWHTGLGLNLTGNKSWRRLVPQLHGGLGFATDATTRFDVGGYRFGTKFSLDYGASLRVTTGSRHELHLDLSRAVWKFRYPDTYGGSGAPSDSSILGGGNRSPWVGNTVFQIGVSRFFLR
jgi:hypothetical protein